jgi:hypothetical protein
LRHPPFSQCDDDPTRDGAVHELRAYRLARHRPACIVAPVCAAPHPTAMHVTVRGTLGRVGAALLLAAAAASVRDAELRVALHGLGAARVLAVLARTWLSPRAGSACPLRARHSPACCLGPPCCSRRACSGALRRARCSAGWSLGPTCRSPRAGIACRLRAPCNAECRPTLRSLCTPRAGSGPCPLGTCEARPTPAQA